MKRTLLALSVMVGLISCRSLAEFKAVPEKGPRKFETSNKNIASDVKKALSKLDCTLLDYDDLYYEFQIDSSVWAWEKKDGTPDNSNAIVVVKKLIDYGANKTKKPRFVTTKWTLRIASDLSSYTIRMLDATARYGYTKNESATGYSTGLLEKKIADMMN